MESGGGWDFNSKQIIDAAVAGELKRATIARWLPAEPQFESVAVTAHASGPVAALNHAGEMKATNVGFSGVAPLALDVTWSGHGTTIEKFAVAASGGSTELTAAGAA